MIAYDPEDYVEMHEIIARETDDDSKINCRSIIDTDLVKKDLMARFDFSENSRVLDVGPGNGWLFSQLPRKSVEYIGVDPAPTVVKRLREKFAEFTNATIKEGRSDALPMDINDCDRIVCIGVFPTLPDFNSFRSTLHEFWRVTTPNSKVWIGECPFRDEMAYLRSFPVISKKLLRKIFRKLTLWKFRHGGCSSQGPRFKKKLPTFYLPVADFKKHAETRGWRVEVFPCVGTNFFPKTRVNYVLTRET